MAGGSLLQREDGCLNDVGVRIDKCSNQRHTPLATSRSANSADGGLAHSGMSVRQMGGDSIIPCGLIQTSDHVDPSADLTDVFAVEQFFNNDAANGCGVPVLKAVEDKEEFGLQLGIAIPGQQTWADPGDHVAARGFGYHVYARLLDHPGNRLCRAQADLLILVIESSQGTQLKNATVASKRLPGSGADAWILVRHEWQTYFGGNLRIVAQDLDADVTYAVTTV